MSAPRGGFACRDCGGEARPPRELPGRGGHASLKHPAQKPGGINPAVDSVPHKRRRVCACSIRRQRFGMRGRKIPGGVSRRGTQPGIGQVRAKLVKDMYRLTPRMLQRLPRGLKKHHALCFGGRRSGWDLEGLIVAAIQSGTKARRHVRRQEAGHNPSLPVQQADSPN